MIETSTHTLDDILALAQNELQAVDALTQQQLHTDIDLINKVTHYLIQSGGKRLRPTVTLLCANAIHKPTDSAHVTLATIIEFIHTATLLHDDVVDDSTLRRGKNAAHTVWSNATSILVGDFLYSRAFQMIVALGSLDALHVLADTTNLIAEGEVLQLAQCHHTDITEADYMSVIQRKTAQLFTAASELGAMSQQASEHVRQCFAAYGLNLGMAFQLTDDALDFSAKSTQLGKNIGDDLAEGKATLPLIYALQQGTPAQKAIIKNAIKTGGRDQLDPILTIIEQTKALDYVLTVAKQYATAAENAIAEIPDSPYKAALTQLPHQIVTRKT